MSDIRRTVDAVWRIEGARIIATLAKMTGDVGLAEDLAQDALADALKQWPEAGVPRNAGDHALADETLNDVDVNPSSRSTSASTCAMKS